MNADHPDLLTLQRIAAGIRARLGHGNELEVLLPAIIKDAIDFVIDPVKTGRTTVAELDNVEKTFIGLKIEHYFRDRLDVPKGLRIANPFTVYGDPRSTAADSSDWNEAFVVTSMTKSEFEAAYPEAEKVDWEHDFRGADGWLDGDTVLVAEYWTREKVKGAIVALSDGSVVRLLLPRWSLCR